MPNSVRSRLFQGNAWASNEQVENAWDKAHITSSPDEVTYRQQKQVAAIVSPQLFATIIDRACRGDGTVRLLKLDVPKVRGKKKVYLEALAWCRSGTWKLFKTYVPFDQPLGSHLSVIVRSGTGRVQ